MGARPIHAILFAAALVVTSAGRVLALNHPDNPIDPSKRAPISTSSAVRPAATPPQGRGVVGDGRIPVVRAEVPTSSVATPQAPIVVSEARPKSVKKPGVRTVSATRTVSSKRASDLPASIPRLDRRQYQKTLTEYRTGAKSASDMTHHRIRVGEESVDLGEINRFASPRAALERQGIPVVSAGAATENEPVDAPVPVQAKDRAAADSK